MTPLRRWRIRLTASAEEDFIRILRFTAERFDVGQVGTYRRTLNAALAALESGPEVAGSVARYDILPRLRTLHVARQGRRGSHFILYRSAEDGVIEVLRILHDAMDLPRQLPPDLE